MHRSLVDLNDTKVVQTKSFLGGLHIELLVKTGSQITGRLCIA